MSGPADALLRRPGSEGWATDAVTKEKQRELDRQTRRRRIEHAKAAMLAEPRMRFSDRKRVARNLWDLLEHFEKGPAAVRKRDVLMRGIGSKPEDSTKRLPRYALRPSAEGQFENPDDRKAHDEKLEKLLAQRIVEYQKIAIAGAELAGEDQDDVLLQLLSGTRYLNDNTARQETNSHAWEAAEILSEQMHVFVDSLSAKYNLARYFDLIDELRLVRHPQYPGKLIAHDCKELKAVSLPYYENSLSFPRMLLENLRLPSIYIGTVEADEPKLALATAVETIEVGDSDWEIGAYLKNYAFIAKCIPTWDIYLAIGPFGAAKRPVPIIVRTARTRVRPLNTEGVHLSNGFPALVAFDWQTIGEFDGHNFFEEEKILSNRDCAPDPYQIFERVILSMARDLTEATKKEIEQAAHAYNSEFSTLSEFAPPDVSLTIGWNDSVIFDGSKSEILAQKPVSLDSQCAAANVNAITEAGSSSQSLINTKSETLDSGLIRHSDDAFSKETEVFHANSRIVKYTDLPYPDWSHFIKLDSELRPISAEEISSLFTKPSYHRHRTEPRIPNMVWWDERPGAEKYDDFSIGGEEVIGRVPGTPVLAPEGSLLALLERWWRGEVLNRAPLRNELEKEVHDAVDRLEAHIQYARESFNPYDIEPTEVTIEGHKNDL
jgi:hypothetical protein